MASDDLIYLACPYSHSLSAIRQKRAHIATQVAARIHDQGGLVYSPITYSAELELYSITRQSWEYWQKIDFVFLDKSVWLYVLTLDGWKESVGVQSEIDRFARNMLRHPRRGIKFINPQEYGVVLCEGIGIS